MKLILLFTRRSRIIQRYLAIKKDNKILRENNGRLEQEVALYKLREIARKKNPPQPPT